MAVKWVRATTPVLGLRRDQIAPLESSPYLSAVIGQEWLVEVSKSEAKEAGAMDEEPPVDPGITKNSDDKDN